MANHHHHDDDASSSSSYFTYDVFLSFRGNTRLAFTDCLYHALIDKRIKVFRDNPDLRAGDEIRSTLFKAIERSRMFIVVLCQEYASSTWCLDEIMKIIECSHNEGKLKVLPVFYKVDPKDVRRQKNQYEAAMNKHESRYGKDSETMKAWRSALFSVCEISGHHCTMNSHEGEIIRKIVREVLETLPPEPLCINHPLGFDSQLKDVKSLLEIESYNTRCMLKIYGDGVVDKTTFAVELYNEIRHQFEAASFLSNVSEKSEGSSNGLEDLQKTLLSEMGEEVKAKIGSTFKGSSEIKQRLGHKRVLLVLDDVDSIQQLYSLAGGGDWFGLGSRIIITTRDDVLNKYVLDGVEVKKYCIDEGGLEGNKGKKDIEGEDVVGLENSFNDIIGQLKENDLQRNVFCIIGMGGLGKTTLAKMIYNSNEVKEMFSCQAWVCVSKDYKAREMLMSLLHCLTSSRFKSEYLSDEELKDKVKRCLKRKTYLIVLDDIWEPEVWNDIRSAFPDDKNGSRILITSRNEKVANYVSLKDPYRPHFLNEEESWKLFCKKIFWGKECPSDLELIGKSIVKNCGGLPIAIVTMAGVLAKKKRSLTEWSKIKDHINWYIANDKTKAMDVLKLSYDDLPQRLKPCFLYFGIYPEDKMIPARDLIRLWIAERFIQPQESGIPNAPEPEDVGEEYLNELVDRSLVQVASRRSDNGVRECQIHDLLRDLCISQSKTGNFLEVCTNSTFHTPSNPHRLSFLCNAQSYISSIKCNQSCTHSLFFFEDEYKGDILKYFQPVSVLYGISLSCFRNAPGCLKRMIHLRFLKLEKAPLPDCIWKLVNLETLDMRWAEVDKIPNKFWKLERLRHLYVQHRAELPVDKLLGAKRKTMWNLQTLKFVLLDQQLGFLISEGIFPNLKNLGLRADFDPNSRLQHLRNLNRLSHLRTLSIDTFSLSELSLDAIAFPSNLTKITLKFAHGFNQKSMNALGRIANLQILKLYHFHNPTDSPLCFGSGDFPHLLAFHMDFIDVEELILEEGAVPHLQRVVIYQCFGLKKVPERLVSLGNLQWVQSRFYSYWETASRSSKMVNAGELNVEDDYDDDDDDYDDDDDAHDDSMAIANQN